MPAPELAVLVLSGLAVGSFLNVVITRVPAGESVVAPGSHCRSCQAKIAPFDNVPLLSWIFLRGRCRSCRARIPVRYPVIEAATALLFVAAGERFGGRLFTVAAACVFFACLLAVSAVDLDHMIIPDRVLFPSLMVVAALLAAGTATAPGKPWHRMELAALGAVASFAAFAVVHLAYPAGMGFGDVKLSMLIGLFLGYIRLAVVPVGFFLAFAAATAVSLVIVATRRGGRKTRIPFGPFLSLGAFGAVMWGLPIARAWLGR